MATTNEQLRDATIVQEILGRRVAAGTVAKVEERLVQLERDLKAALASIDPAAVVGKHQEKRILRLHLRVAALHKDAYADIRRMVQEDAGNIAYAMSQLVARDLEVILGPVFSG